MSEDDLEIVPNLPASIDACVIDLDGTLTVGDRLTLGARELVTATQGTLVVLSNNSSHSQTQLADELAALELAIPASRIVLAGVETVRILGAEHPGARVMLLGSPVLAELAAAQGLVVTCDEPQVVLLARDERFGYEKLTCAANALRAGARLIVTNGDRTHPGADGSIVPETGAMLAALRACVPDAPHRVIGKPEPHLFEVALRILGTRPARTLMIGDNPATDGRGAERAGMPFLAVRDCDVRAAAALVRARMRPIA